MLCWPCDIWRWDKSKNHWKRAAKASGHWWSEEALLVEGLTANLLSISQICDLNLIVNFTRDKCSVISANNVELMQGSRSKDNCYQWTSGSDNVSTSCLFSKADESQLWHQRLGHLNLKSMKKIISEEAISGVPPLKITEGRICGECRIGKQVKMSHKKLQHITTSRVLELLHVDLMGPMQTESMGGKRYVLMCVDDYSRYTWVEFIREKSDTFSVFKGLCNRIRREQGENIGKIIRLRSDHGTEFENNNFSNFLRWGRNSSWILRTDNSSTEWHSRKEEQNGTGNGQSYDTREKTSYTFLGWSDKHRLPYYQPCKYSSRYDTYIVWNMEGEKAQP